SNRTAAARNASTAPTPGPTRKAGSSPSASATSSAYRAKCSHPRAAATAPARSSPTGDSSVDDIRDWWEELRENWQDPYWRADHPEVQAFIVAVITGTIGLIFAFLEAALVQWRLTNA